jgi:hypothetical protein
MTRRLAAFAVASTLAACSNAADNKPVQTPPTPTVVAHEHHHEDRNEPAAEGAAPLALQVKIPGATQTWQKDSFDKVPKVRVGGTNNNGENRDTWSLRELAHTLVGPQARVVAIVGAEGTRTLDRAAWDDTTRTPILHTTRRGTLKFRYADQAGTWGQTELKDVTRIEIEP